jgi:hypothetical protein
VPVHRGRYRQGVLRKIISHSAGAVNGDKILFYVVFECMVCNPTEAMILEAKVMTITKAGIHAVVEDDETLNHGFRGARPPPRRQTVQRRRRGTTISVRVIGSRFELNDQYICVIATLERDTPTEL